MNRRFQMHYAGTGSIRALLIGLAVGAILMLLV